MSSTGKRLDLRFGAFACSVQGFDDPVQPVQQVLRAIQHLLEESPELSDTAINFDAEAIEQLVEEVARRAEVDENQVEIVPGLVMIHHGAGADAAPAGETAWDEAGEADYVNIFAPAGGEAEESAAKEAAEDEAGEGDTAEEDAEAAPADEFPDRLRQMAAAGTDDYAWADEGADEEAGDAPEHDAYEEEEPAPVNLFASGAAAEAEPEAVGADGPRNLFAVPEEEAEDDWVLGPGAQEGQGSEGPGSEGPGAGAQKEAEIGYTAAGLASRAGAQSVAELMVSSAAWMVLIQGQTTFKRRDVLDVFETIPGEHDKSLEACIKGFGKAVRNGQLVMIEDGIFGLSRAELERFQGLL